MTVCPVGRDPALWCGLKRPETRSRHGFVRRSSGVWQLLSRFCPPSIRRLGRIVLADDLCATVGAQRQGHPSSQWTA